MALVLLKDSVAISVHPDDHGWGNAERYPVFHVLSVPGEPVEALRPLLKPAKDRNGNVRAPQYFVIDLALLPEDDFFPGLHQTTLAALRHAVRPVLTRGVSPVEL